MKAVLNNNGQPILALVPVIDIQSDAAEPHSSPIYWYVGPKVEGMPAKVRTEAFTDGYTATIHLYKDEILGEFLQQEYLHYFEDADQARLFGKLYCNINFGAAFEELPCAILTTSI